jgi:hypothetical protein
VDGTNNVASTSAGKDLERGSQPVSGPMDLLTALWYVNYTAGQLGMFQRDGSWYLRYQDYAEAGVRGGVR